MCNYDCVLFNLGIGGNSGWGVIGENIEKVVSIVAELVEKNLQKLAEQRQKHVNGVLTHSSVPESSSKNEFSLSSTNDQVNKSDTESGTSQNFLDSSKALSTKVPAKETIQVGDSQRDEGVDPEKYKTENVVIGNAVPTTSSRSMLSRTSTTPVIASAGTPAALAAAAAVVDTPPLLGGSENSYEKSAVQHPNHVPLARTATGTSVGSRSRAELVPIIRKGLEVATPSESTKILLKTSAKSSQPNVSKKVTISVESDVSSKVSAREDYSVNTAGSKSHKEN
jgi:hypothetical protein